MTKYVLTYEDAVKLTVEYKNFNYSMHETVIDGYKVVTFAYFLCDYQIFMNPIKDSNINGLDMRGTTFVFNKDGTLWKKFMMIPKFFNANQVESTQYSLLKDKKIKSISNKEDGSLIAFMMLPNGTIFAKTIKGFTNEQVKGANLLLNSDKNLKNYVKECLNDDKTPLFEFVSRFNRIVLPYGAPELKLIGIRDNISNDYIPVSSIKGLKEAKIRTVGAVELMSLGELLTKADYITNIEGWVIEFEDGQMVKIKTNWYFNLHGLRTDNIFREDYVIKNYLEEKLDDLIGQLDKDTDKDAFLFVDRVLNAVDNRIEYIDNGVNSLEDAYYNNYDSLWVEFATREHATEFFGLTKTKIFNPGDYKTRKLDYIINKTNKLQEAEAFVNKWTDVKDEIISKWRGN